MMYLIMPDRFARQSKNSNSAVENTIAIYLAEDMVETFKE
jgi:hypothetical protein